MTWESVPLGRLYHRHESRGQGHLPLLSVYRDLGVVLREGRDDNFNRPGEDLDAYKKVAPGDLVLNKMKTWQGSLGVSSYTGIVSPAYFVARRMADVNDRFMHHLLRSQSLIAEYGAKSKGIRPSQWDLPWDEFAAIRVWLPSLVEQQTIADYLDTETARIDALITKKQQLIELLEERQQVLITGTVLGEIDYRGSATRNRDTRASPRGNRVKNGWSPGPLKYWLLTNDSGVWGDEPTGEGDTEVLRSTDILLDGGWSINDPAVRSIPPTQLRQKRLCNGDLVVVTSSGSAKHLGKTAIVTPEVAARGATFANFVQRLTPGPSADSRYLWYFLNSKQAGDEMTVLGNTTTGLRNLNGTILGALTFSGPPIAEQQAIVDYLDTETARISEIVQKMRRQIGLLREHRQALITAAVTGELEIT